MSNTPFFDFFKKVVKQPLPDFQSCLDSVGMTKEDLIKTTEIMEDVLAEWNKDNGLSYVILMSIIIAKKWERERTK